MIETIMLRLCRIVLTVAAGYASALAQTGSVVGTVVDPEGASIGGANVVLAEQPELQVQYKATTMRTGEFRLSDVQPGTYTLTIEAPGFLDNTIPNIRVTSGESRGLKTTALKLAGCFAPGMMCDTFGMGQPIVHRDATVDVPFKCGVDADGGKMICKVSDSAVDFRVRSGDNGEIYVTAAKGARIALDTRGQWSLSDCVHAEYSATEIRVDQLKYSSRVCVHTNGGRYAEVYSFSGSGDGAGVTLTYLTWP